MNRRQLMNVSVIPLFGMGAFPESVAAHMDGEREQPRAESDDDIFRAVYMFDRGKDEFVVRGIYTNAADADAHVERLKSTGHTCCGSTLANRAWLQNHFIGERMGAMQDVLERLEARLMIDANRA